jgi:hypothetical protein
MNFPRTLKEPHRHAGTENSDRRAFMAGTLGVTAGLVGVAAPAEAKSLERKMYASWAHGCTTFSEGPNTRVLRQGFGTTFTILANRSEWIHLPVPTPVIVEGVRASLGRMMVLFHARHTSSLAAVHVYDGPNRILTRDGLSVEGNHALGLDSGNSFPVNRPNILWGVSASLLVTAGSINSEFFISSFGVDFFHDL